MQHGQKSTLKHVQILKQFLEEDCIHPTTHTTNFNLFTTLAYKVKGEKVALPVKSPLPTNTTTGQLYTICPILHLTFVTVH